MTLIKDLDAAKQLIEMQLKDIDNIFTKVPYGLEYTFWEDFTARIIDRIYGNGSSQRHGFEQAGRGGCFSVFESYSERQRRENYIEIVNCKKEYLENLVRDLENRQKGPETELPWAENREVFADMSKDLEDISRSEEVSPLDRTIAQILAKVQDPSSFREVRTNLLGLRNELLKPAPSWAVLREYMVWLIQLGRQEFFSVLPFIVLYVRKITD